MANIVILFGFIGVKKSKFYIKDIATQAMNFVDEYKGIILLGEDIYNELTHRYTYGSQADNVIIYQTI